MAKQIICTVETITNWELNRCQPALEFLPRIVEFLGYNPFTTAESGSVGEELKQHRRSLGLSRKNLAKIFAAEESNLAGWETGRHKPGRKCLALIPGSLSRKVGMGEGGQ